MKATLTLSPEEVKEAVVCYLKGKNITPGKVELKCSMREVGHQMNSRTEPTFDGADVEINIGG